MDYPNVLFCSLDAALLGEVARQVATEGHDVRYYIERPGDREIADGFVEKTDDWRADLEWADLVVFDDIWIAGGERGEHPDTSERGDAPRAGDEVGTGELAEELRVEGIPAVGGSPNTDRLEADRGYAMDVLEANGAEVLPHREFHDFEAAREYVREHPAPYVIKPLGEVQNVKHLLYVAREADGGDEVYVRYGCFRLADEVVDGEGYPSADAQRAREKQRRSNDRKADGDCDLVVPDQPFEARDGVLRVHP